ncbi:MAG: hypothetical protein ACKN9T_06180 [Candidatus Methylumidiphilus sp.]
MAEDRLRTRIALEAARIMAEEGIDEHGLAKKKAAARLGVAASRNLPRKEEIEAALVEHQRLFAGAEQPLRLARLRKLAAEAMRLLSEFSPLLVGGVWNGGVGKFSPIRLHLFAAAPEDVMRKLWNARIPFEEKSHSLPPEAELPGEQPALHFYVDGTRVELLLFPATWKGRSLRKKAGQATSGGDMKDLLRLMDEEHPTGRSV